jgi:hypothetical protein
MKHTVLFLLAACAVGAVETRPAWFVDPVLQSRVGFDTNPVAVGGTALPTLGASDALTFSAGLSFALATPTAKPGQPSGKLTYAGETFQFDGWSSENYTTHRLGGIGQLTSGNWRLSAEGSALWVDGNRDTLLSIATCNANATALWRERRAQWQHRLKALAQYESGKFVFRANTALLAYDYLTNVTAGHAAFADRSDLLGGTDFGWKQSARSLWFVGLRAGDQFQDTLPVTGGQFEYSNTYWRAITGWEGRLGAGTTLAFAAGPDFRHFDGNVDSRVFAGRDRTSLWFEGSFTSKVNAKLTITGKVSRWVWLSSTGKSAYIDACGDTAAVWALDKNTSLRATIKLHQCLYYPTVRDDWECLTGVGVTYKLSARTQLTGDVLVHRGWNDLTGGTERDFSRQVFNVGVSIKL